MRSRISDIDVGRSTIARILRAHGIPPVPERPTSWQTFLRAHWGAIAAADFFTTEVWTWRGLVTFYTVFVIELASRRVQILGSTPHPDDAFMRQIVRTLTPADAGGCRLLICDRDAKWSAAVRARLADAGLRVIQTPYRAPNANAYAERFVRSIKEECLNRLIPFGERHLRRAVAEFVAHYHRERNHQGLDNELIEGAACRRACRSSASASTSWWVAQLLRTSGVNDPALRLRRATGHCALSIMPTMRSFATKLGNAIAFPPRVWVVVESQARLGPLSCLIR